MFPSPSSSVLYSCGQHIDTLGITFLVVVLVQSAHVDTMHWQKLFSRPYWLRTDVMREMRCNGCTESRPGDVFHPDFLEARSAYLT